jgi:hypothetical protein
LNGGGQSILIVENAPGLCVDAEENPVRTPGVRLDATT